MKQKVKIIFVAIMFAGIFTLAKISSAAIDLSAGYWETTYDCDEWDQSLGTFNCDGISRGGDWICDTSNPFKLEQITIDANYPLGKGGKGQRHWIGDGENINSGGLILYFDSPQNEIWIRWYARWGKGFTFSDEYVLAHKLLYFSDGLYMDFNGWNGIRYIDSGREVAYSSSGGWNDIMDGRTGDGKWHGYQIHIKANTSDNNDGIAQIWIDDELILNSFEANFTFEDALGWERVAVPSNQRHPINGRCMYVDIDDIAVATPGYTDFIQDDQGNLMIGSVTNDSPNTTAPLAPSGLAVN